MPTVHLYIVGSSNRLLAVVGIIILLFSTALGLVLFSSCWNRNFDKNGTGNVKNTTHSEANKRDKTKKNKTANEIEREVDRKNDSLSKAKIQLGQYLFYDTRLSANNTKSCASCHAPELAFSDGYRRSSGIYADQTRHNAPSLLNVGSRHSLTWADPHLHDLEKQMLIPLFGTDPIEMGAKGHEKTIYERLEQDSLYRQLFQKAYPKHQNPISFDHIIACIASFLRTLRSQQALFETNNQNEIDLENKDTNKCENGNKDSLNLNDTPKILIKKGQKLFFSKRLNCAACHNGPDLGNPEQGQAFANIGLQNLLPHKNDKSIPKKRTKTANKGQIRIPALRNVAITAPYLHDGSVANLSELVDLYQQIGQLPNRDPRLSIFTLSNDEKQQLIAFLHSLTDTSFLKNPNFLNPFAQQQSNP